MRLHASPSFTAPQHHALHILTPHTYTHTRARARPSGLLSFVGSPSKLHCQRLFHSGIESDDIAAAVDDSIVGNHLCVEVGVLRQHPSKGAVVPVVDVRYRKKVTSAHQHGSTAAMHTRQHGSTAAMHTRQRCIYTIYDSNRARIRRIEGCCSRCKEKGKGGGVGAA